jgi:hypothetical protein
VISLTPPRSVIGVDCATVAKEVGLARARFDDGRWRLLEARVASPLRPPGEVLVDWLRDEPHALLALDAPLGWPAALGPALAAHLAGNAVPVPLSAMFQRATDHVVRERTGKRPLEVGADRIARTAWVTLALLEEVRTATGLAVPLAWEPALLQMPSAIEVYPAATLRVHGLPDRSYKEPHAAPRAAIDVWLRSRLDLAPGIDLVGGSGHLLDAILCVVAGLDFLAGAAPGPDDLEEARREGWIWVAQG